jgi:hypothetical protein
VQLANSDCLKGNVFNTGEIFTMSVLYLHPGDTVLAGKDIYNDGSFPGSPEGELLVKQGTRGMIVNQGYLEDNEKQIIFLVKFEYPSDQKNNSELGPPIGCWPEDLDSLPMT